MQRRPGLRAAALAGHPDAFTTAAGFDGFRGSVQATLGCALNPGSLHPRTPDPLPVPGGYNSATQYCGPGDSTADWRLGLVAPDTCLNLACYEHDRCTAAGGQGCDAVLLAACAGCKAAGAGSLFSWLTPDSYVLCSALRSAAGTPAPPTTTTTTTSLQPSTLPGATSTSSSSTQTTAPTAPGPTMTSTTSTTSTTASAVGKDLIPENILLGAAQVQAGGTLHVTWDVTNHGTIAVSENFCDKLWLSADAALGTGDTFLVAQCHFGIYDPGEGDTRALDVPIPAGTPAGPAFLLIETDVQFTVTEGNEANNVAGVAFTI